MITIVMQKTKSRAVPQYIKMIARICFEKSCCCCVIYAHFFLVYKYCASGLWKFFEETRMREYFLLWTAYELLSWKQCLTWRNSHRPKRVFTPQRSFQSALSHRIKFSHLFRFSEIPIGYTELLSQKSKYLKAFEYMLFYLIHENCFVL